MSYEVVFDRDIGEKIAGLGRVSYSDKPKPDWNSNGELCAWFEQAGLAVPEAKYHLRPGTWYVVFDDPGVAALFKLAWGGGL